MISRRHLLREIWRNFREPISALRPGAGSKSVSRTAEPNTAAPRRSACTAYERVALLGDLGVHSGVPFHSININSITYVYRRLFRLGMSLYGFLPLSVQFAYQGLVPRDCTINARGSRASGDKYKSDAPISPLRSSPVRPRIGRVRDTPRGSNAGRRVDVGARAACCFPT